MENLLDLYHRPYDPKRPLLAMDEHPVQLIGETRIPVPERPGHPRRYDYEYERHGTAANFLFLEPLTGRRKGPRPGTQDRRRLGLRDPGTA